MSRFTYIDGINIHTARKVIKFCFGDFLLRVEKNDAEYTFDIYLFDKIDGEQPDEEQIKYFVDYWGDRYRFFKVKTSNN